MSQLSFNFPDMKYTFADFFSGAGGFSLGLIQAGMKCVSAMEMADDAAWTYWTNLCYKGWSHLWIDVENKKVIEKIRKKWVSGDTNNVMFKHGIPDNWLSVKEPMPCLNLFLYDITKLEPEEWMDMCGVRKGDIKVFIGGPPCQGFSLANSNRNIGDERNQLPLRMIYYAKVCQPDYVLIENVPGLLTLGKQKGEKESPFVKWIRNAFEDAGYDMHYEVHNAADYGVPQRRKRVLFFAARKGLDSIPMPEKTHGEGLLPYVTVREAIGDLPPIEAGAHYDGEAYGYNKIANHVICRNCLKFVKEERKVCPHCKGRMDKPITGGVFRIPEFGLLLDCEGEIPEHVIK